MIWHHWFLKYNGYNEATWKVESFNIKYYYFLGNLIEIVMEYKFNNRN